MSSSKYDPASRLVRHIHDHDYDACRRLVEHAPDVVHSTVTHDGLHATPLVWAAHANAALDISRLLLEHRADVNATAEPTRRTALHAATAHGNASLVRLLCDYGATVDDADVAGISPLHTAAVMGDAKTTGVLLHYGADAEQPDHAGRTPLHLAVSSRLEICQLLLEHRADINAMDDDGFTPLDTALLDLSDEDPIVMYLVDEGARTDQMRRA